MMKSKTLQVNFWDVVVPVLVLVGLLVLWQFSVQIFELPQLILPTPLAVAKAGLKEFKTLAVALLTTGAAALAALAACGIFGLLISLLFSQSAVLRRSFFPYVIFLQTVPIVAIAPLLILWSGVNFQTIVLVATIIGLFPVISNTTNGLLVVPKVQRELFRINRASRWQELWKLRLPSAIPAWALGLRISSGLVVIGAIVGEFFVGSSGQYDGLGSLIFLWQGRQYTAGLIAAVVATTILGLAFFGLTKLISNFLLNRWTRGRL